MENSISDLINNWIYKIKAWNWNVTFLLAYAIILMRDYISTTMFEFELPRTVTWLLLLFVIGISGIRVILEDSSHYIKVTQFMGLVAFCVAGIVSSYHILLYFAFLVVAAQNVDFDDILKVYVVVSIICILFSVVGSQVGLIENLIYPSLFRRDRISFGFISPTDFGAHITFLVLAGLSLVKKRLNWLHVLVTISLAAFVYFLSDCRTSVICLIGYILCVFIYQLFVDKTGNRLVKITEYILIPLEIVAAASMFIFAIMYENGLEIANKLEHVFSLRLSYTIRTMQLYNPKMFGQYIEEHGNGESIIEPLDPYFIDNSFVRMLYEYGIVVLMLVLITMLMAQYKAAKKKRTLLVFAIFIMFAECVMEHHIIEIAYNPFGMLLFANLTADDEVKNDSCRNNTI